MVLLSSLRRVTFRFIANVFLMSAHVCVCVFSVCPCLHRTYTVEWTGTESGGRFEIDLYHCGSYCQEVGCRYKVAVGELCPTSNGTNTHFPCLREFCKYMEEKIGVVSGYPGTDPIIRSQPQLEFINPE